MQMVHARCAIDIKFQMQLTDTVCTSKKTYTKKQLLPLTKECITRYPILHSTIHLTMELPIPHSYHTRLTQSVMTDRFQPMVLVLIVHHIQELKTHPPHMNLTVQPTCAEVAKLWESTEHVIFKFRRLVMLFQVYNKLNVLVPNNQLDLAVMIVQHIPELKMVIPDVLLIFATVIKSLTQTVHAKHVCQVQLQTLLSETVYQQIQLVNRIQVTHMEIHVVQATLVHMMPITHFKIVDHAQITPVIKIKTSIVPMMFVN